MWNLKALSAAGVLTLAIGGGAIGGIIATSGSDQPTVAQSAAPVTVHQVAAEVTAEPTASATPSPTSTAVAAPVQADSTTADTSTTTSSGTSSSTGTSSGTRTQTQTQNDPAPAPAPAKEAPAPADPAPVATTTPKPTTCAGESGMPEHSYADGAHVGPRYDASGQPIAKSGLNCDAGQWVWDGHQYPTRECAGGQKPQVSDGGYTVKCVDDPDAVYCYDPGTSGKAYPGDRRKISGVDSVCQDDGTWKPV